MLSWVRFVLVTAALAGAAAAGPLAGPERLLAQSQTTAAIRGVVTSADTVALDGAEVRLLHLGTGAQRRVATDERGGFVFLLLPPGGPYELTVSHLGFAEATRSGIALQVGETFVVELALEVRAVEVEGLAVEVRRDEVFSPGRVGPVTLLSERVVAAMPILSRDVMELATLSPLVRVTEQGGFSIGGQNDRYNAILVDGLANGDPFGLTAGGVPGGQAGAKLLPLDAVAQYEIAVAPFDARLSGFAGGVLNAVTRTGTNDWQVSATAVGRHETLMGDLTLPTGPAEASGVKRGLLGLAAGGPLARDRAHVFVAAELERRDRPPSGYNLGRDAPELVGIDPDSARVFEALMLERFGVATGEPGPYALEQDLANVFARVDWQLGGGHRLTARNVFARAANDESPHRGALDAYELASNAVFRESASNVTALQLFSELSGGRGHELDLTVQRTTDRTEPAVPWPQLEIRLPAPDSASVAARPTRMGAQFFAQANDLAQTSVRLASTFTQSRGEGVVTLGVAGAWHAVKHTYLPGATGEYYFGNLPQFHAGTPLRFQRATLAEGEDPAVSFDALELGLFAQHQFVPLRGLTVRYGLRADLPLVRGRPTANPAIEDAFGHRTDALPRTRVLLSPRLGFNWQGGGRLRTQLRGGAGLFTGQLPYVWLANAFHNDGLRSVTHLCEGEGVAPPFDPDQAEVSCLGGTPTREIRAVTMFDRDFVYPQYVKLSAALDRELTPWLTFSGGFLFTHSVNQVSLRELNIEQVTEDLGPLWGYGSERQHFGDTVDLGFRPRRPLAGYEQVLLATNDGGDRSWSLSAELRGRLGGGVEFQAGYAYQRSYDRMSLASVDLIENYGLTPARVDPNRPLLNPSNFDRPHKVVLAVHGTPFPGLDRTEVSLLYTGESGLPFSYVYRGDLNGDGFPGPGPAFDRYNDLVYVPSDALGVPATIATVQRLAAALETDPCLRAFQGRLMLRNHCRAPWQNRLDLRLAQTLEVGGSRVRLEADVVNVLNLLDADRGLVQTIRPVSPLLEPIMRDNEGSGELLVSWGGSTVPFRDAEGQPIEVAPWSVRSPESQWQAQLGVKVAFGAR